MSEQRNESSAAQGRPKSLGEATGPAGRGEAGGPKPSAAPRAATPRFYALRRSLETGEAYWFWTLGKWDVSAGFFKGFGLGLTVQQGEWDLTLGPFSIGGVHE